MPQTTIDKALCQAIRPEIDAALAIIAARHGLQSIKLGNISYNPAAGNFTGKITGCATGCATPQASKEERNYFQARMYNPELPELNMEVNIPIFGGLVKFVGKKSSAFGNEGSFLYVKVTTGQRYRVQADRVIAHFKAAQTATPVISRIR